MFQKDPPIVLVRSESSTSHLLFPTQFAQAVTEALGTPRASAAGQTRPASQQNVTAEMRDVERTEDS